MKRVAAAVHLGVVMDRSDPSLRGRLKVRVPAVYGDSPSPWALPIGLPLSGATGRGFFAVPDVGATVAVMFAGGDPDRPLWTSGPWAEPGGISAAPDDARVSPPDNRVLETGAWLVEFDDGDPPKLLVRMKGQEMHVLVQEGRIEVNAPNSDVTLSCANASVAASGNVTLEASGNADVTAAQVTINGQAGDVVTTGTHPVDYVTGAPINGVPTVKAG